MECENCNKNINNCVCEFKHYDMLVIILITTVIIATAIVTGILNFIK